MKSKKRKKSTVPSAVRREPFVHVALVLPTEFAYGNGVLRGIINATRNRNFYSDESAGAGWPKDRPWLFRVYRGAYGHSTDFLARSLAEWDPDGIICQIFNDDLAEMYRKTGKPLVEIFEDRPGGGFPRILLDDVSAGRMAAEHFLQRGFKNFAYLGSTGVVWSLHREQGFLETLSAAFAERAASDQPFTFSSFWKSRFVEKISKTALEPAIGEWLASLPKPVALFAANDNRAFEAIESGREARLSVPEQIAIVGVDNEELLCDITHPQLSSIAIGSEQMGRQAVSALERVLLGEKLTGTLVRVPPVGLITRQSSDVLAVSDPVVAAAIAYIRKNFANGSGVKQMLNEMTVSRRSLERRFVKVLGRSPLDEIQRVRIDQAKLLLRQGLSVREVARKTGFSTARYLATGFVAATGVTPSEYRRENAAVYNAMNSARARTD